MPDWMKFIGSLGKVENSIEFIELNSTIDDVPIVSEDSKEYDDPAGHTKYYKYVKSGLEIGFRKGVMNHAHFYFDGYENYAPFQGKLLSGICSSWNEKSVLRILGEPSASGGGNSDMLLGYINRWIKYEKESYALHLQFDQNDFLCRASLMIH
ncbi:MULTISPECIES: hypothetical protein [unclassified Pantoea]|uniref:hypothetical protein n=1 Tax=unclassified Pantoea TaxID=2630326 RepID=UPI0012327876|nr:MULTISPECIES: hypothetical protein [unclassified Pantoea]KAA5999778.1 hypothetical protein F3I45_16095 [Pantoea sp. F_7]KAA6007741.1 hypothetical protein F3I43_16095 [Pantoea sp. F_18]KAA6009440.1 hypothetical protein F3I44_16100 [Pantoea sp. F_5]KAA6012681.1 hypothetical protein F3I40_16095 [Pantoea sp. F_15]KAA6021232.1 hypothetical protein F3I42_16095 [Pantoea sp. F_17]